MNLLLNRNSLSIAALASKDDSRFMLNGLHVTSTATVATDGYVLGMVSHPTMDAAEFPAIEGIMATDQTLEPCTIPTSAAKDIEKSIPKRPRHPILGNALIDVAATNGNGTFKAVTTDLETTQPITVQKVDGEYPNYQLEIDDQSAAPVTFSYTVNAKLLAKVLTVAAKISGKNHHPVTLEFTEAERAVKITTRDENTDQTAVFLVMPCQA